METVSRPPQTTMSEPVHTVLNQTREDGALRVDVGVQVSLAGSYRPPVSVPVGPPPQTIMELPVQTAVCLERADGAPAIDVGPQESVLGS